MKYGFDAPGIMRGFLLSGGVGISVGVGLAMLGEGWWRTSGLGLVVVSVAPLALGMIMLMYGLVGKRRMCEFMMQRVQWQGNERVLDVGTGLGLLLIAAAKRLDRGGKAVGIDIWREEDLSGNSLDRLAELVDEEGVEDRVSLIHRDARALEFLDESFDVVMSLYCIHNIEEEAGREQACLEIARVLKPGGRALVGDYQPTHEYAKVFGKAGLEVKYSRSFFGVAWGPMWMVEAVKPRS